MRFFDEGVEVDMEGNPLSDVLFHPKHNLEKRDLEMLPRIKKPRTQQQQLQQLDTQNNLPSIVGFRLPTRLTTYYRRNDALDAKEVHALDECNKNIELLTLKLSLVVLQLNQSIIRHDKLRQASLMHMRTVIQTEIARRMTQVHHILAIREGDRPPRHITERKFQHLSQVPPDLVYRHMGGLRVDELAKLMFYLRFPDEDIVNNKNGHVFTADEILIVGLMRLCAGKTFVNLADDIGGDSRRLSFAFGWFRNHLYQTFYNANTGDSSSGAINRRRSKNVLRCRRGRFL